MAGASMNSIKSRIKSVSGTMQITKAMELVATSKLRRAREKIESSRPFHTIIKEAIDGIEASEDIEHGRFTAARRSEYRNKLAFAKAQIDTLKSMNYTVTDGIVLFYFLKLKH